MAQASKLPARVYKICDRGAWEKARLQGHFLGSADDVRDGFIHLSAPDQVAGTLNRHFAHQDDLLLISVDTARLGSLLRWEPSRDGALFPHLYAPLEFAAVVSEVPLARDAHGQYRLPGEVN